MEHVVLVIDNETDEINYGTSSNNAYQVTACIRSKGELELGFLRTSK